MEKNERAELEAKGLRAARAIVAARGMEILNDEPFECEAGTVEIVAKSRERGLVFVSVEVRMQGEGFPSDELGKGERDRIERVAMAYLRDYEGEEIPVTFDRLSITVTSGDRALMRWHQNALV